MNKAALLAEIVAILTAEITGYLRSARAAQAEAAHEQSKAENKYDTRSLEAGYLARGQSRQAAETAAALAQYQAMVPREFGAAAAVDLGAVVEVETGGERALYFIGPCAGGMEVAVEGQTVVVLSPQSPMGQQVMGKKAGSRFALPGRGGQCRIVSVA